MYASNICSNCFIYFRHVLSVFHLDITKVDLNVVYTCMLQAYVSNVRLFQGFHLDVAYILQWLHIFFPVFQTYVENVSAVLQMYIASVSSEYCKSRLGVTHVALGPICCSCKGIVHARGKRRDRARRGDGREKWRGMVVGA
jgi:hypothetical protein